MQTMKAGSATSVITKAQEEGRKKNIRPQPEIKESAEKGKSDKEADEGAVKKQAISQFLLTLLKQKIFLEG